MMDEQARINQFVSYVVMLTDSNAKDDNKLRVAQEIAEELESLTQSALYPKFLEHAINNFLKLLVEGEPQFVAEYSIQQLRKLVLEIMHRLPTNDHLKIYHKPILSALFKLIEIENEENALVILRIIIEFSKNFRPAFSPEVPGFLQFIKKIYQELPSRVDRIFEQKQILKVKDMNDINMNVFLLETFSSTPIQTEKKSSDGTQMTLNILPKSEVSLKLLAELPIIVVLIYQIHKGQVYNEIAEFIPLIMTTIIQRPSKNVKIEGATKEIFVDFIAAQIKTFSFLAYIVKIFQDTIMNHADRLASGLISLLEMCPQEVAGLRKELLIAARHILAIELRDRFVGHLDKLFDERVLIGTGFTAYDSLRPLAYSNLADLVHHIRQHLPFKDLSNAVNLFAKNVHDESLPITIQTMSCKLLLNLVECIRTKSERENTNGRELLMRMLEVFVLKFKTIAKLQLPNLVLKNSKAASPSVIGNLNEKVKDDPKEELSGLLEVGKEEKLRFGFPTSPSSLYSIADCRSLVKTLVCGVKTITWGIASCKVTPETGLQHAKQFHPKETQVFIRLVKYGCQALDVYLLPFPSQLASSNSQSRSKEEKEVLEHFAGVFQMMHAQTFREVFSTCIDYMVERIHKNVALQIVANSFLASSSISPIFATILVEYLLGKMKEMGYNVERSGLYLKLFKLVFGSVSLFASENEQMLKPNLHLIVNRSMELALTAKEPYNYFLLLRALFRSIGGGSHDQLYQEFLPLLPSLLQGLNSLQSGLHKQHMKDLFVELCLTVPVRLSSLLPYLPMLMDPLVSALNGSQTLVSQGLRTLELCVDNLQPDFLYVHISPVRAELMQALWKTLRNPTDNVASVAFRILGKLGGGNRKVMLEPQMLNYNTRETEGPCLTVYFEELKNPINLPVEKIVDTAFNILKTGTAELFYKKQCWEVLKGFVIANLPFEENAPTLFRIFSHHSFTTCDPQHSLTPSYLCRDEESRKVMVKALAGIFFASNVKEYKAEVDHFIYIIAVQSVLVSILQQHNPFNPGSFDPKSQHMDTMVIVDALVVIMGYEEKEMCKVACNIMTIMLNTAICVFGTKERACHLGIFEYLAKQVCSLFYKRAWYAKLGGCYGHEFFVQEMSYEWLLNHQYQFLRGLMFVLMDLTGEVSSGALDMAKNNVEMMLRHCCTPLDERVEKHSLIEIQIKSITAVTEEFVRQVTSPNNMVREQSMEYLKILADIRGKSITDIIKPHKEVLAEMIPPKKHLLRHQPVLAQIGIMDGNRFCMSLKPPLFSFDLTIQEHQGFFQDILAICEQDNNALSRIPCYKNVSNFIPLRKSALRALASCHYLQQKNSIIFDVFYKVLCSGIQELQELAFESMQEFLKHAQFDMEQVHKNIKPLLLTLGDYRSLNLLVVQRISYLTQLFPASFNEKLCEQLLGHLQKWLEVYKTKQKTDELKTCLTIIQIFYQIPAASSKFIEPLVTNVLKTEKKLLMEAGSPFRESLIKYLQKFCNPTIEYLLNDTNVKEEQVNRFILNMIKGDQGRIFRNELQLMPAKLCSLADNTNPDIQYHAIMLTYTLVKYNPSWLSKQVKLMRCLRTIWASDSFQSRHQDVSSVDYSNWKEPKVLAKCLLNYFQHQPLDIELLFQLLRAFAGRFIPDYEFLRNFLEKTVCCTYALEWKRKAFFKFVEVYQDRNFPEVLKAKILQFIIIPMFSVAFEKGEGELLIGGPPAPDQDLDNNIISVFINKVIDPDKPFATMDQVRILVLQFSCLLVEQASPHIHDAANKRQGSKLRRLMTYAWPCLLTKSCVDPATKYHGHLLLAHIIAKFAIHKRIVLQVFHSLLKAHAVEAKGVIKQALEVLTPAMPARMEDGNTLLTHWTKKIIIEEGHMLAQLIHMLQLVVRHFLIYYPVRHALLGQMVSAIQRLGFTANSNMEHKKLAVDLAEVTIRWEEKRVEEDTEKINIEFDALSTIQKKDFPESKKTRNLSGNASRSNPDPLKPIDKSHSEAIVNFLLRIACQVNENSTTSSNCSPEIFSRRCVNLLKLALRIWPNTELKLAWFDKLLLTIEQPQPNYANICTALELLTFLINNLKKEVILSSFRPLQRGIVACMNCQNSKVIKAVHSLMSTLMTIFPADTTSTNVTSRFEELECLYASISKVVFDGFSNYEKTGNLNSLFGSLMVLKAACVHNPCAIDRLITAFMRVLQKLTKDHLSAPPGSEVNPMTVDLLIIGLDLVKNRVGVMGQEMRKGFIGNILVGLIEKSPEVKVVKGLTKMVEDWVKNKSPFAVNMCPTMREKSILLVKMMQFYEKRFPDEHELIALYLEIVNFVYRLVVIKDETMKSTEISVKLEGAFMAGLRCTQPQIRAKFFEVFDQSMRRRLTDRLLYIFASQNWETIGSHFWIQQCLELLLVTATTGTVIQGSDPEIRYPTILSLIQSSGQEEPMDIETIDHAEVGDLEVDPISLEEIKKYSVKYAEKGTYGLKQMITRHTTLLAQFRDYKTISFLTAASQLCHMETPLAESLWITLFPRIWKILSEKQQSSLMNELTPFITSGSHVFQKDFHPSALGTFVEALLQCHPPIYIKPAVLVYLGRSHNLWHRACLQLENIVFEKYVNGLPKSRQIQEAADTEASTSNLNDTIDSLAIMYNLMKEQDLFIALWQKRATTPELITGLAYEQQGCYEHALNLYEKAIAKMGEGQASSNSKLEAEYQLVENAWINCNKELGDWNQVIEYVTDVNSRYVHHLLDGSWRDGNWKLLSTALSELEKNASRELAWKVSLYHAYLAIFNPDDETKREERAVERYVDLATTLCIREWRRLPSIVSNMHLVYLQASQQVIETQEAAQIHVGFLPANQAKTQYTHDMKAIVKSWRSRLPIMSDSLLYWSDVMFWREHHYKAIVSHMESANQDPSSNGAMLGVHASAQSILHMGKVARKHGLSNVCLEYLNRIHSIVSVPILDCYHKIRQQVKCYMASSDFKSKQELQDALDIIESTNLRYFTKDMVAEFQALKGFLLTHLGQSEEASKSFASSTQLNDNLSKGWGYWGDYLEMIFTREKWSQRNIATGIACIVCCLHACRQQNETKSRKYLAKTLWLLAYDDEKCSLADTVEKYHVGIPTLQWLPWIPQLLTCLVRPEGKPLLSVISNIGRLFPQAIYFPIRTLYLTLKIEQRERCSTSGQPADPNNPIKATAAMWRCSRIMQLQRDFHPTILSSLEGIVDQMVWFRENCYEEVLRQLKQALAKCYSIAFENRGGVSDTRVSPQLQGFVKKVVSTFGVGFENSSSLNATFSSAGSESLARRAQASTNDPVFQKMKQQFTQDFDFSSANVIPHKLQHLITKLKKWIKILESKAKTLPSTLFVEERCRFLSNFTQNTADVEMPGEFLMPKARSSVMTPQQNPYYLKIARFLPNVESVNKYNTSARRLFIRGHNGKIYPYLIVNDACLRNARREERVLQLLRMLNTYLGKQKETSRRYLNFTVPKVVPVSPQMRLIEDNPSSISLYEIYVKKCAKRGIEHELPIVRYYEKLSAVQAKGNQFSHQVLRDILKEVQNIIVPRELLRDWALQTYPNPTDYWTFRNKFALQLAMSCFAEYTFYLTRLNPDMMNLHQDSGLMSISYFKFEMDDTIGDLVFNRPVPFRLTPNISEFINPHGVNGLMTGAMIAMARCFVKPSYKLQSLLRAILRDEMITWHKKKQDDHQQQVTPTDMEGDQLVSMVNKSVQAIVTRLQSLAQFDNAESKVNTLVVAANSPDNLCRMDPAWHPWL